MKSERMTASAHVQTQPDELLRRVLCMQKPPEPDL